VILGAVGLLVVIVALVLAIARGLSAGHAAASHAGLPARAPVPSDIPPPDAPQHEGGAPDWPILVDSAARIEPRAGRERCSRCGAEVRVGDHEARLVAGRRLRVVHLQCRRCGGEQALWFMLAEPLPEA